MAVNREDVRDNLGHKIGQINHDQGRDNIYNGQGRHVGYTDQNGTRDHQGRKIADKPQPGLLWPSKKP